MTNALTMLAEFDKYFQSMNRVPPEVRTSVPTAEWVALRDVLTALAAPAQQWTCFHCGEVCAGAAAARLHFGASEHQQPSCQIDLAEYRRMEEVNRRHCEEDTDLHRELHRMECKHQQAQRRAEEAGYAKGLADGRTAAPAQPDGLAEFLQFRAEFRAWRDAQSAAPAQPNTWREAVLDALASTGGDMPATATPAEIVRAVIDVNVQIALDPRVSDAAPAQQPEPVTLPEHQRSAPPVIYLHDGDDGRTEPFPAGMDDGVTWSSDNATGAGVPYVRADLAAQPAEAVQRDAARYRLLRRGQHWSIINGIGDTLRADELDAAIDTQVTSTGWDKP